MKTTHKTLVIHIADPSTDFLKEIYLGKVWDLLNHAKYTNSQLKKIISEYDRIVMLGHGSPEGLFGYSKNSNYIVDASFAELLKTKECVYIFCNADMFVKGNNLKGFYSGMFISEVGEANHFNIKASQKEVDESNQLFAKLMSKHIFTDNCLNEIKSKYTLDNNKVSAYNNNRLYQK